MIVLVLAAIASFSTERETSLVLIERRTITDIFELRSAGLPVVLELEESLLMEGDADDFLEAEKLGYKCRVLDSNSQRSDYLLLGVRDTRKRGDLASFGNILWVEKNLVLLKVERGTTYQAVEDSAVFVTKMGRTPLDLPQRFPERNGKRSVDESRPDPIVEKIVAAVEPAEIDRVWTDLVTNPPEQTRYSTHQGCRDAAEYCHGAYVGFGLEPIYHEWQPAHAPNVVAEWTGAIHPERIYIIEGHLDDLPASGVAPGANDNASGSVAVLETARVNQCWAFRNTVRYLNVTGEEQGLLGSDAYAEQAKQAGEDIRGVLNFDMIGWEGDGVPNPEDLDVSYNSFSQWLGELFAENATKYSTGLVVDAFYCPSLNASDHYPFWQRGYPAIVGITDNEDYCGHGGNYPDYHSSTDTIEACGDPSLLYATIRTAAATLAELAEPFKVTFDSSSYTCDGSVSVVVGDRDLNTDPSVAESIEVTIWSDTESTPEVLVLNERSVDSMLFEGSITLTTDSPVAADGALSITEGDEIRAEYEDALDCDGAIDVLYTASARVDCTSPLISGVGETGVTDTTATIVWNTDEIADEVVVWDDSIPPTRTTVGTEEATTHAVDLAGLTECTVYYYEVQSTDVAGNSAVANNGGNYFHFETMGDFGEGLQPCHEGRVGFDAGVWSCRDTVSVYLVDRDLNRDPENVETAVVHLSSSSEDVPEEVVVTETGANSSRFEGTIATDTGSPKPDGTLQTQHDDIVTVTYHDADDGTGKPAVAFDTASIDCDGPAISNLRVESITDARAQILFETDEPATTVIEWGRSSSLGEVYSDTNHVTSHRVLLNDLSLCGDVHFRVRSADIYGHERVADDNGSPHAFQNGRIPGLYWKEDFEQGTAGWILEGEWEIGLPQGLGGSTGGADPQQAYNNANVLGHDLSGKGAFAGDYEPNVTESASSPVLDATSWTNTKLLLYKRLNVGADDDASLWLWAGPGRLLYRNDGTEVLDESYIAMGIDVALLADGRPSVHLEFRQDSDASGQYSGWNVDDLIFKDGSLPDYAACGGCARAPAFAGGQDVVDDDACAAGSVTVSWERAVAWGSGNDGTYALYRGISPGFMPTPDRLVASGLTATSFTDTSMPPDESVYYLVRAENDESCASGPANGGMLDDNEVYLAAHDSTSSTLPGEIVSLDVGLFASAHVRLSWSEDLNAAEYFVERSLSPAPGGFARLGTTTAPPYDDIGAGADRETYFYLVGATDACGRDVP